MDIQIISGPVIGAVIGYFTNYIAVKMLFRPLKPVKIGKYQLPFTPGMIPKGKDRLGKAIGEAVGGTLLSEDVLAKTLLSEDTKNKIKEEVQKFMLEGSREENSISSLVLKYVEKDIYDRQFDNLTLAITDKMLEKAAEMDLGNQIAAETAKAVKEKVQGSFLAIMLNDTIIDTFIDPVGKKIDSYIEAHGKEILLPKVEEELNGIAAKNVGQIVAGVAKSDFDFGEIVIKIYENLIRSKLGIALEQIDVKTIVENKIVEMDVLELEQLVLSVMKKELTGIVNLGAIIGLLIGILNLLFI